LSFLKLEFFSTVHLAVSNTASLNSSENISFQLFLIVLFSIKGFNPFSVLTSTNDVLFVVSIADFKAVPLALKRV